MLIKRCPQNPIIVPGTYPWRRAATYNPAALYDNGTFYLFERAAASLRPHQCWIGLLESDDGVHFTHVVDQPVFTPAMMGWEHGSVQDPRVVKIDGTCYMVCAARPYSVHFGQPPGFSMTEYYPDFDGREESNWSRSIIATSHDMIHWKFRGFCTPDDIDDRDNMLFAGKAGGRFAMLHRPQRPGYDTEPPGIWITFSDDLKRWDTLRPLVMPRNDIRWEAGKIGASTPPILTSGGWLVLYHGVDRENIYRVGAMLLDRDDPFRIIARTKTPILEPIESYERTGLFIGNVVFPCGMVEKEGLLYIYYGCADTSIALATVPLNDLLEFLLVGGGGNAAVTKN